MAGYFIKTKRDGQAQGPFTTDQLKTLAARGKLKPHYLISKDQKKWYVAKNVKGLLTPQRAAAAAVAAAAAAAAPSPRDNGVVEMAPARTVPRRRRARKRSPVALLTVLGCLLVVGGIVGGYLLFGLGDSNGDSGEDELAAVNKALTGKAASNKGGTTATTPPATTPAAPTPPPPAPPATTPPAPPVPVPDPIGKTEPKKSPASLALLSVAYGGQQVQAMGSQLIFALTNNSSRGIKSVKGHIRLYAPPGDYLIALPTEIDAPIAAGATIQKRAVWLTVDGRLLEMLDKSGKQMKFKFAADQVTYDDGKTVTF